MRFGLLISTALLGIGSPALGGGPYLPEGVYAGTGGCKTTAGLGDAYVVRLQLDLGGMSWEERPARGGAKTQASFTTADRGYGFFDVNEAATKVGDGYCGKPCQMDLTRNGDREVWTFALNADRHDALHLTRALWRKEGLSVCETDLVQASAHLEPGTAMTFVVDAKASRPADGGPSQVIPEKAFQPIDAEPRYDIARSKDGNEVTLTPLSPGKVIKGKMEKVQPGKDGATLEFKLQEGTFAGGRLVLFDTHIHPHADLLIYGSGVPILSAERGQFFPLVR